ncbi:probable fructokinase-7 [Ananas comosus]|uniref:Probable fructokinase-7 n=1 Tax=Ananas comosus TaxID=4615 RepID=A0A6P5GRE1_ANACO|nr:probable fructokinase-7 [Ananas comosus]
MAVEIELAAATAVASLALEDQHQISEEEITFLMKGEDPYDDAVVLKVFYPDIKLLLVIEGPDAVCQPQPTPVRRLFSKRMLQLYSL